ncbi:MAG: hypothetical protein V4696_07615 [Pseudomonadota bacterium]
MNSLTTREARVLTQALHEQSAIGQLATALLAAEVARDAFSDYVSTGGDDERTFGELEQSNDEAQKRLISQVRIATGLDAERLRAVLS